MQNTYINRKGKQRKSSGRRGARKENWPKRAKRIAVAGNRTAPPANTVHSQFRPYIRRICIYTVGQNPCTVIRRVGQNHIYTVYIRYFWQGNHQIYGHIRCISTVLANPSHMYTGMVGNFHIRIRQIRHFCMYDSGQPYVCCVLRLIFCMHDSGQPYVCCVLCVKEYLQSFCVCVLSCVWVLTVRVACCVLCVSLAVRVLFACIVCEVWSTCGTYFGCVCVLCVVCYVLCLSYA